MPKNIVLTPARDRIKMGVSNSGTRAGHQQVTRATARTSDNNQKNITRAASHARRGRQHGTRFLGSQSHSSNLRCSRARANTRRRKTRQLSECAGRLNTSQITPTPRHSEAAGANARHARLGQKTRNTISQCPASDLVRQLAKPDRGID